MSDSCIYCQSTTNVYLGRCEDCAVAEYDASTGDTSTPLERARRGERVRRVGDGVYQTNPTTCPQCKTSPAYRTVHADPWDRHETCPQCGYCYSHAIAP